MSVIVGRDSSRVEAAGERFGWAETETEWRRVIDREDIGLVDICSPGATQVEIAIAALEAGKHVLCEKPLANTVEEARRMADAARRAAARQARSGS
jgi:predicted dehydrogenase